MATKDDRIPRDKPSQEDEGKRPEGPDGEAPHDEPDEHVIEKTLPKQPKE